MEKFTTNDMSGRAVKRIVTSDANHFTATSIMCSRYLLFTGRLVVSPQKFTLATCQSPADGLVWRKLSRSTEKLRSATSYETMRLW